MKTPRIENPAVRKLLWWTRLQPIPTISEIDVKFVVFTHASFQFQRIRVEARRMRRLGMSFRSIGAVLGVDEKTVRKALGGPSS